MAKLTEKDLRDKTLKSKMKRLETLSKKEQKIERSFIEDVKKRKGAKNDETYH